MLTEGFLKSSNMPEESSVSEVVENQWYGSQKIINLITRERDTQSLQYVFSFSGEESDPCKEFIKQFQKLIKLGDKLNSVIYFISPQPGTALSQHFVFGIVLDKKLVIINPMGQTSRKDFYKILFKIKNLGLIQSFSISNTVFQRDPKAIVSCGPICVELFNHFASLPKETILKMAQGSFKQENLEYSEEELQYYSLINAEVKLAYSAIDVSKFLPESLIGLLGCGEQEYLEKLKVIRQEHTSSLPKEDVWPPEQSLVFQMMANEAQNLEDMEDFSKLKKKI